MMSESPAPAQTEYEQVLAANIAVHSSLAKDYNTVEPHFRPENVARVEDKLRAVCAQAGSVRRWLDLGCGTGFMIQLAKPFAAEIDGVDATASMLAAVNRDGPAQIRLFEGDTGRYPLEENRYDVATAYSFLHHLYDIRPTLATAYRALRPGGMIFADLDPNYYFWEAIKTLNPQAGYDPIVSREIAAVTAKDEEIQRQFGVDKETFNRAEYQKAVLGGFREEDLRRDAVRDAASRTSPCSITGSSARGRWSTARAARRSRGRRKRARSRICWPGRCRFPGRCSSTSASPPGRPSDVRVLAGLPSAGPSDGGADRGRAPARRQPARNVPVNTSRGADASPVGCVPAGRPFLRR